MISHRVADHRLEPVKDDLLPALRRSDRFLDACREDPRDPAPLQAILETIGQISWPPGDAGPRGGRRVSSRNCVPLIQEQAEVADEPDLRPDAGATGQIEQCWQTLWRVAWLRATSGPEGRTVNAEETLHRARQQRRRVHHGCHRSRDRAYRARAAGYPATAQHTLAVEVDGAPGTVRTLGKRRVAICKPPGFATARHWSRAASAFDRLDRIVGTLAAGPRSITGCWR